ncbi:D-isomer specific 2-hydroxyacid dehydrogenase, NAD binding domain [Ceratobasidium sp. AG-Ba]|nr:D-isomer specific 2-hydroxyacid dehydrogenase, NAD binding domain [Ceratobasidium sp. AG-Ba]
MSNFTKSLRRGVVILAQRDIFHGKKRLKALEERCHFAFVEPTTRDDVISQLGKLAAERPYEAMLFFPGFWIFKIWDKDLFGPFAGTLKLVVTSSAGYDHIDVDYLSQKGAYLANSPAAVAEPTAMTTLMLILQTVRNTTHAEMTLRRGKWRAGLELTDDIRDMTIGIIGNGRIGQLVQKKLQALGTKRILYNSRRQLPPSDENGAIYKSIDDLLKESDLVTLHCPYTPETRHLLSDAQFALMKRGSYLVNTSRGPVIDEEALVRAMKSGQIGRVGLDVFENEPDVHPYLMQSERATLFPHWGSSVKRAIPDVDHECLDNLEEWLKTGVPNTPVNKPIKTSET